MRKLLLIAFLILAFGAGTACETLASTSPADSADARLDLAIAAWSSPVLPQVAAMESDVPEYLAQSDFKDGKVDVYGFKRKSPTKAFLFSFLIPGWGQVYAKSPIWRPILFAGVEVASWAGYASFHGKGKDNEVIYKNYADMHWDSASYIGGLYQTFFSRDLPPSVADSIRGAWLDTTTYLILDTTGTPDVVRPFSLSHHAWYKDNGDLVEADERYENIGKYNQFNFGWDDYPDIGNVDSFPETPTDTARFNYVSPNRRTYLGMRDAANREFNKANKMIVVAVANHLLAGFWAAIDARAFNRTQDQFGRIESQMRLVRSPSDPTKLMTQFTLGYRFR